MALKLFMPGADPEFPVGGAPTLQWGAPTYEFAKFSEKLHEIEKNLGPGGWGRGVAPWRPVRSASACKMSGIFSTFFLSRINVLHL